jgi:hypothetical protein
LVEGCSTAVGRVASQNLNEQLDTTRS